MSREDSGDGDGGIAAWVGRGQTGTRSTFRRMSIVVVFIVTRLALYLPIFALGSVI